MPNRIRPVDITNNILQLIFMYRKYWRFMDNHKEIVYYFRHLKNINVSKSCSAAFDRKKYKNYISQGNCKNSDDHLGKK